MNKLSFITLVLLLFVSACKPAPYSVQVGFNNGSTTGRHIVSKITITTISGGKANFAMGSVSSYPGAYSSGGRMDAPAYIEGYWAKGNPTPSSGLISYHRISAKIPQEAEAKMKVMDNYYKNFKRDYGSMQVIVDGPRVRVFYTKDCSISLDDCTPKKNADPNDWVVKDPRGIRDVVVLFDGMGESSSTPFPNTHFAELEQRKKDSVDLP